MSQGGRCPHCGASIPPGAKYCTNCGAKLTMQETKICQRCGALIPAGAKYCTECGASQTAPAILKLDLVSEYQKIMNMLEKLNAKMIEGEIKESIYEKIRGELEARQKEIMDKAKERIEELKKEIPSLQERAKSIALELEELEARHAIGLISSSEYEHRKMPIEREHKALERRIKARQDEIRELENLLSKGRRRKSRVKQKSP